MVPLARKASAKTVTAKVLIIDDDAVMRSLLRKLLEISKSKLQVLEALNGEQAKRLIAVSRFDCLVLDHLLPDTTGLEFLKWLRAHDQKTPVVVFTGMGDEALAVEMMKAGATDYLTKVGFSSERFVQAVSRAINSDRRKSRR